VRPGTVTRTACAAILRPPVVRANPIHAPLPAGTDRAGEPSSAVSSAPLSRTVSGPLPGLTTDTASCMTVPGSPSA